MKRVSQVRVLIRPVVILLAVFTVLLPQSLLAAQRPENETDLPVIQLDIVDGYRWSDHTLVAAPGQRLQVTNRDVQRHSFAVDEWDMDLNLPTLIPVEVIVPDDVEIGTTVVFYSGVADDREQGLEGIVQIIPEADVLAGEERGVSTTPNLADRGAIEIGDDFTFNPAELDVAPGSFIEIRNTGVIEHHFVVDEWNLNETIPAGDIAIVQVPEEADPGSTLTFYCSVPGHQAQGMTGTLSIVATRTSVQTISPDNQGRVGLGKDLRPFVPDASFLGQDWTRLRTGDASSLLQHDDTMPDDIFPDDGLGAIYVGPEGSRVTLIVLPLTEQALPANQIREAVEAVQGSMMETWNKDRIGSAAYTDAAPPAGCDVALRASGIVPVLTIPGGATACQLRSAGVAIFVTVEGSVGDATGVAAADTVVSLLLTRSPEAAVVEETARV